MDERTTWKDSERVAQFVANVIGGVFVVVGMSGYITTVFQKATAVVPSMGEYFGALLLLNVGLPPCWADARSLGLMAAVLGCFAAEEVDNGDHAWDISRRLIPLVATIVLFTFALTKYKWIGWFCWLQLGVTIQWLIAVYQIARVSLSVAAYFTVKFFKLLVVSIRKVNVAIFGLKTKHAAALRQLMKRATSHAEWFYMAQYLDVLEEKEHWKADVVPEDHDHCDFYQLNKSIHDLTCAIETRNIDALRFLLPSFVLRNKMGVDSADLHLNCSTGTKHIIEKYNALVIQALELLSSTSADEFPADEKAAFFRKLKQSFGSSALCLSGGGAIAMYHMGIIKALLLADLLPNVVSGSSGGSIIAAMAACKTNRELLDSVISRDIATRYIPFGIRWFPPLIQQLEHCVKTGFLVECSDFERTTQHYYGEPMDEQHKIMHYTFQDAFLKTGRHVCITVSASDVTGHKGPKKLLLNHINTPHVLLWSAVAVSCSLPGIMKGKKLMARDHEGNVVPYDAMGKEWVDGSIQHDLPMETMASCFNVTNFIVSQVNPHVVPFVGDDVDEPTFRKSLFHTLESVIAADVRHRLKMLAFLGLFPKIYGHQFSSYFKQNFSGHVTLIPEFIFLEAIGIKAILNPTREDMDRYIMGGQRAVWPKLAYIGHLCAIEKCLDKCLSVDVSPLDAKAMRYDNWLHPESDERVASTAPVHHKSALRSAAKSRTPPLRSLPHLLSNKPLENKKKPVMTNGNETMTLPQLVDSIETLLQEEPDVPLKDKLKIQHLLESYPIDMQELKPFALFESSRNYTRNLISTDHETYALMLICWNRGKYSPIHDHPSDGCWVKVVQGHVNEVRYARQGAKLAETGNTTLTSGVTYMDDSLGLHKVGNPRDDVDAITMHLYAPPYEKCRIWFDPEDADKSSVAVSTYFSEFGEKVEM